MVARRIAVLGVLAACRSHAPTAPSVPVAEGLSVMVFGSAETGFGIVDDRRRVVVQDGAFTLDRIDEGVALSALWIEPIDPFAVGACTRERIDPTPLGLQRLAQLEVERRPAPTGARAVRALPAGVVSPVVRCATTAAPGRYLVRLVYQTPAIRYRAQHELEMTAADRVSIATRFALVTPAWGVRASVALFDGLPRPEGARLAPPREVAHGTVALDGSTVVLSIPVVEQPGTLRWIYDGAVRDRDTPDSDVAWGRDSRPAVWVWLELVATLPPGPIRARVALAGEPARDVAVGELDRARAGERLRLPMWIDDTLTGQRRHTLDRDDDRVFSQHFELAVENHGHQPREVWIEERLRSSQRHRLSEVRLGKPVIVDGVVRTTVNVPPADTARASFTVRYTE